MKKTIILSFTTFAVSILGTSAYSFEREPLTAMERRQERTVAQPEIVNWKGSVRCNCKGKCEETGAGHCNLEFVRDDGEIYALASYQELENEHCRDHTVNLTVALEAEKTPRFLFWGGQLVVKKFEVMERTPGQDLCTRPDLQSRSTEGREAERGGKAIL